jgi:polyhydroxybutyrate depolymerase
MRSSSMWSRWTRLGLGCALGACAALWVGFGSAATSGAATSGSACGLSSPAGLRTIALTNQGQSRPFLLYVPRGYTPGAGIPVVFDLHGSGGNGAQQLAYSQIEPVADAHGFAVIAPNGAVPVSSTGYDWNVPGVPLVSGKPVPPGTPSDERYLVAVLDKTEQVICVNPHHVYMTGFSGGARMTSQMACDHSRILAAVAPVSGLRAGIPIKQNGTWSPNPSTCQPLVPVPILTFHGTADKTNPYGGDDEPRWGYSVITALKRWAQLDHCSGPPTSTTITQTETLISYAHCSNGSSVSLYRSTGTGHAWPGVPTGSVPSDASIHATPLIWRFFHAHSR